MDSSDFNSVKRYRTSNLAQLTKIYKDLERQMTTYDNVENVKALHTKLCDRFEQFKSVHLECLDLCTEPEVSANLELSYESCHKNFMEFRERFSEWMAKIPDDEGSSIVDDASISSSVSSKSRLRSAKAKRLIAEYKLKKLKQKHALERERKELEIRQETLEQECEVEEAQLEESVWQEAVEEENAVTVTQEATRIPVTQNANFDRSPVLQHTDCVHATKNDNAVGSTSIDAIADNAVNEPRINYQTYLNQEPDESLSTLHDANSVRTIDLAFQKLASTLQEGFNLPKPELLTFDGSVTDYYKFIKNFETNIECKVSDDQMRLSYLIQYCKGEAKCCIEDCVLLEPSAGYKRARSILFSRFGRPHMVARSYVQKLVHGPQIKASDTDELLKLALEMQKCEITMSQLGFLSDIDSSDNLRQIVKRLPMHLRVKWVDVAHSISESGREPCFSDLSKFVDDKSRLANSLYGLDLTREDNQVKHEKRVLTSKRQSDDTGMNVAVTTLAMQNQGECSGHSICICCSGSCSDVNSCAKFKSMSLTERYELVRRFKLCYNCLKGKHVSKECRKAKSCTVSDCNQKHHFLLHKLDNTNESDHTVHKTSTNCAASTDSVSITKNCLGIVPVIVKGDNGNTCRTYALLDDGADKTLCDERLLKTLNVVSRPVTFNISTVSSTNNNTQGKEVDLRVYGEGNDDEVILRKVWSVKQLPISLRSLAVNADIKRFPHLTDINLPPINTDEVMLLIGTDSPDAHIPLEIRSGGSHDPYAIRSRLGWAVRGPTTCANATHSHDQINVNFQQSTDVLLQQQLERLWKTDFDDKTCINKTSLSVEDRHALQTMETSISHEDGHYKLGLPWRKTDTILPNNVTLAKARLQQLKHKLSRDANLHEMYTKTVNDYIAKGYAKEVTDFDTESTRVWYLPHHPVMNINKPGKVRVVFDCAAKYLGTSLNSQLLQGPDFMNNLVGVLIRFRQENIAIASDIEAMFHQVRVVDEDCNALRFLWWPSGELNQPPKCYCMRVHLFGATSSPSCAAFALKQTAKDNVDQFEPDVISTVNKNFYVDDCLKSVKTPEQAKKLASDLQSLMKLGGFRLTKWLSNSRDVLNSIPESERASSVVNLSPGDKLPNERALGVQWNINEDSIVFKVKLADKALTRRGMLSIVSSIFDPLGLVSPVTLRAKAIMQSLCRQKIGWDEEIPQQRRYEWREWLSSLSCLEKLCINRCFKPKGFGEVQNAQLHLFSDGSELGYGACAYLRLVDENKNITCSLIIGKSRLAPLKQISIPRLELSGAVVACRLYEVLREELEIKIDEVTFWTDSMIVLGYIRNTSKRFKTFVGNRLSIIQDITTPDQWRYVDSSANPADIASRGVVASDDRTLRVWSNGPAFLHQDSAYWPSQPQRSQINDDDIELKMDAAIHSVVCSDIIDKFFAYFSDWYKLRRAVAWLLRFKMYCKYRYLNKGMQIMSGDLELSEIKEASIIVLSHVQNTCFPNEIKKLQSGKSVKKDSRILSLNPVLDDGLLRMNGRVDGKTTTKLIILPNDHHVTKIIIRSFHENQGHIGAQQVLSTLRTKYWILRGLSSVKKIVRSCIVCKRQHGALCKQQMAPFLDEQITPDKPPFTFVGIDYFGPLMVKIGRSHVKRYGCLFTCLASRAIHIEVVHSMTTDSFISAFQRFVSRRGVPEKVYSDNGSNLVCGEQELRKSIVEWNQTKLGRVMSRDDIEWHFNPPCASHMGGAWERMIRSTRSILKSLVKEQLLNDEQLLTLMAETEKIINDRPITAVSNDPNDPLALTPNMLLLMKSNSCIPQGVVVKRDIYAKRWWKQVQYMANVFWKRWMKEYLPTLQLRLKWHRKTRDISEGDVVLIAEDTPRGQWPLARVIKVHKGRDGHVRSCEVRSSKSQLSRPITKLCLLECAC